jgi:hypothetical protein
MYVGLVAVFLMCLSVCLSQEHAALKKQLEKALTGAEESQLSAKSNKEVCMA